MPLVQYVIDVETTAGNQVSEKFTYRVLAAVFALTSKARCLVGHFSFSSHPGCAERSYV